MKRRLLALLLCSMLLSACGNTDVGPGEPVGPAQRIYNVDFSTLDLGNDNQIFLNGNDNWNKVINHMNSCLGENLVNAVYTTIDNTTKIEKSDFLPGYENVQGLIVGTKERDGEFYCSFTKVIHKITIKAQQYYNIYTNYDLGYPYDAIYYDGQEYVENPDGDDYYQGYFKYTINDQTITGPGSTYQYDESWQMIMDIPQISTNTITIDRDSFTIKGYEAIRTRIYEMEFEFEADE